MPPTVPRALATLATIGIALGVHTTAAQTATAQTPSGGPPPIATGTRVRVTAPAFGPKPRVARVLGAHGDTLVVQSVGRSDSVSLPVGSIERLEVSGGQHTRVLKGMGVGVLAGAAVGALDGSQVNDPLFGRGGDAVIVGIAGAAVGTVVGGVTGAIWTAERWDRVQFAGRSAHLRVGPGRRGGVALALAF